jgi:hypothetical protein
MHHLPLGFPIDGRQASHLLSEPLMVEFTGLAADPGPYNDPIAIGQGIYQGIPALCRSNAGDNGADLRDLGGGRPALSIENVVEYTASEPAAT